MIFILTNFFEILSSGCAHIDTKYVHVIAESLPYPFAVAISQNHYYWTDWKTLDKILFSIKYLNSVIFIDLGRNPYTLLPKLKTEFFSN